MGRKIFKIKGNFEQNGEWSTPDPGFEGKIVVDDEGTLFGWCDELYEMPSEATKEDKVRYLVGVYNKGDNQIKFYKLSNDRMQVPLLYERIFVDGEAVCDWSAASFEDSGVVFQKNGDAKIELEEINCINDSEADLIVEEAVTELGRLAANEFLRDEVLRSGECPNFHGEEFQEIWASQTLGSKRFNQSVTAQVLHCFAELEERKASTVPWKAFETQE